MVVQILEVRGDAQDVIDRLLAMRYDEHFMCQCAELKWLFRPHLDDQEIWNSWWNDMRQGETLPPHQDFSGCAMYCFYVLGSSPVVVEDVEYPVEPGLLVTFPSVERHSVPAVAEDRRLTLVIETSPYIRAGADFKEFG